jgi:hypothetical protein
MNQATAALLGALIGGAAAVAAQILASSMQARQASKELTSEVIRGIQSAVDAELESGRVLRLWVSPARSMGPA